MARHPSRRPRRWLGVCCVLLLAGCAPRPAPVETPVAPPAAFSASGTLPVPERWWTSFADADLDTLLASALSENLDLRTAWERLQEARAGADVAGAARLPSVDAILEGAVRRPAEAGDEDGTLQTGLAASWEIDLWGRIGAQAAAEELRAGATLADYRAIALSLSAEVVQTWYGLVEVRAARALLGEQLATTERSLAALQARFGTGLVRGADILRQQQLLEATREQLLLLEIREGELQHRLALLLGRTPAAVAGPRTAELPALPPLPDTGLPADILQRRPDVQRAYLLLQAADRDLAAAVSARYPRLALTASVGTSSAGASEFFADWVRSLAGNLLAPIFRGGELSAEVDRARARKQQRLYEYGQAVLVAVREVEDALLRERIARERIASLEVQVGYARETHRRLRLEFFNGVGDFLDLLTSLVTQQRLERDLLAARLVLLEDRIALYRALAGGFATGREADRQPSIQTGRGGAPARGDG